MVDDRKQFEDYMSRYDELALDLLNDDRPNTPYGLPWSNADLVHMILENLDWEFFDILRNIDYNQGMETDDYLVAQAYAYIAFLRMLMFSSAFETGFAEPEFNKLASATSEMWFKKLTDRAKALTLKEKETNHTWVH